ncbi:MAG: NAD(P)-dependent oxidoreductase [Gammaproteobacteria bacterium]|nr:NAD(P)-dependent oxidoreductase [Gammaproteobacteria bacterium]
MPDVPTPLLEANPLPRRLDTVDALEDLLSLPSKALVDDLAQVDGDLMILGVAGKMGPTLARLAKRAAPGKRVIGVARFSDATLKDKLHGWGIETITADLLDRATLQSLPRTRNIVFAAGHKFGASGNPALTWAMNTWLPGLVAETFADSRIVAFSTGNVYALSEPSSGGATEDTLPGPVGEYAQSCLGRERMFEYFSDKLGTPGRIVRLNYAIDLRYGVLLDIAARVQRGDPVALGMGHVNVIWQGDANSQVLRALRHCTSPTTPINCTGPDVLSVRALAEAFGSRLGRAPVFSGQEAPTALLSDTRLAQSLFGPPAVPLDRMLDWVADWVARDGTTYNKPTKFEVRDGTF